MATDVVVEVLVFSQGRDNDTMNNTCIKIGRVDSLHVNSLSNDCKHVENLTELFGDFLSRCTRAQHHHEPPRQVWSTDVWNCKRERVARQSVKESRGDRESKPCDIPRKGKGVPPINLTLFVKRESSETSCRRGGETRSTSISSKTRTE